MHNNLKLFFIPYWYLISRFWRDSISRGFIFAISIGNIEKRTLSGILPKSGPLDFATKDSFPLFFVGEKALVGIN